MKKNKTKNVKSSGDAISILKNEARGAVSKLTSVRTGKKIKDSWRFTQQATSQLNKISAKAKELLTQTELDHFEDWLDRHLLKGRYESKIGSTPSTIGALPPEIKLEQLSAALSQAYDALSRSQNNIYKFTLLAIEICEAISNKAWEVAEAGLIQVERIYGYSYWLIETKISVLTALGRIPEVTDLIKRLSIKAPGLNSFFLYHFRLRNDVSQSASRYRAMVLKRIADSDLKPAYRQYASFRLTHTLPRQSKEIAAIIAYEQFTSRIDLLFSALKVSFFIIENSRLFSKIEISFARDIIDKFGFPIFTRILIKDENNHPKMSISDDLRSEIYSAIEKSFGKSSSQGASGGKLLGLSIAAALSYDGDETDEDLFKKYSMNFSWIPEVVLLNASPALPKLCDLFANKFNAQMIKAESNALIKVLLEELDRFLSTSQDKDESDLYHGSHLKDKNYLIHNDVALWEVQKLSSTVADCMIVDFVISNIENGNYDQAIKVSAHGIARNSKLTNSLPLADLFSSKDWQVVASYGLTIELCCCLHSYLTVQDDSQIRTFKGFAIEELMIIHNCESIIELSNIFLSSKANKPILEQFLSGVCDLPTLELLPCGETSRKALNNRYELLLKAASLKESAAERLLEEAELIKSQLEVTDVLNILDESLVYVDEESLLTLCAKEFSNDFERYRKLVVYDKSAEDNFDELMLKMAQLTATSFSIPKRESHDLMLQMLSGVIDIFVNHSVSGLDTIIGRRIRHGTISDELRGTLEHIQLIGQRPRTGAEYQLPEKIQALIRKLDTRTHKNVVRSFGKFFHSIDTLIVQLRDEVFQCKVSEGKLEPAFELKMSPVMVALASDLAAKSESIEKLLRLWFQVFWLSLSQSVEAKQKSVTEYVKTHLRDSFDDLTKNIKISGVIDVNFLAELQQASELLQRKAILIGNWIKIPRVNYQGLSYPMELVFNAVLAIVKAQRPGFNPECDSDIQSQLSLDARMFPIVSDAIKIALVNISEHSGVKKNPKVIFKISTNERADKICFEVVNEVAKGNWSREKENRVCIIREDIFTRHYANRALQPKGSGLSKLAAIVTYDNTCNLEFGIMEGNKMFRLYFELKIQDSIIVPVEIAEREIEVA